MSSGPRFHLDAADEAARRLRALWGEGLIPVGSVRRRNVLVGDLEFVARAPAPGGRDTLYEAIIATMEPAEPGLLPPPSEPIGRAIRGLKRGFLACSLEVRVGMDPIAVQVFRSTPVNHGWVLLCRTGPALLGEWFLSRWKDRYGIQKGDGGRPASVDGHLVDKAGKVVPVPDEGRCFELLGVAYIEPEDREAFAAHATANWVRRGA